jgi:hypothetical protein
MKRDPGKDLPTTFPHLDEARRLITIYARDTGSTAGIADAVAAVWRRLMDHFGPLVGPRAAQALLARAVYVSKPSFEALDGVPTREVDGDVIAGLVACLRGAEPEEALRIAASVLSAYVGLLTRFIGEDLGLRLLREAFPESDRGNFDEGSSS